MTQIYKIKLETWNDDFCYLILLIVNLCACVKNNLCERNVVNLIGKISYISIVILPRFPLYISCNSALLVAKNGVKAVPAKLKRKEIHLPESPPYFFLWLHRRGYKSRAFLLHRQHGYSNFTTNEQERFYN